ncbi:hypothetical protein Bca4012_010845 [Brassica carinata]
MSVSSGARVVDGDDVLFGVAASLVCSLHPHHMVFRVVFSVGFYVRTWLRTVAIERQRIQASLGNAPSGEDATGNVQNVDPMRS